jgi:hypothetical protein
MTITAQPITNGKYTAYLPIELTVGSVSGNPEYIEFELQNTSGVAQAPKHRAYKVTGNIYKYNVAPYIKPLLDLNDYPDISINTIGEYDNIFKAFRVQVSDPLGSSTAVNSNNFFATASLETKYYGTSETFGAVELQSEIPTLSVASETKRLIGKFQRFNIRTVTGDQLVMQTFNNQTPRQTFVFNVTNQKGADKIFSIPIRQGMFNLVTLAPVSLKLWNDVSANSTPFTLFSYNRILVNNKYWFDINPYKCFKEFLFINRFGVIDTIIIETKENETLKTNSQEFNTYQPLSNNGVEFVEGAMAQKINQKFSKEFQVESQYFTLKQKEYVEDFLKSKVHFVVIDGNLKEIVLFDGTFQIVNQSKGGKLKFKYKFANQEKSFI